MKSTEPSNRGKQTPHKCKKSHRIQLISAIVVTLVGCTTLLLGFFAPPPGEIHPSILVAFGETLTFAGTCFGIDYHYKFKRDN